MTFWSSDAIVHLVDTFGHFQFRTPWLASVSYQYHVSFQFSTLVPSKSEDCSVLYCDSLYINDDIIQSECEQCSWNHLDKTAKYLTVKDTFGWEKKNYGVWEEFSWRILNEVE